MLNEWVAVRSEVQPPADLRFPAAKETIAKCQSGSRVCSQPLLPGALWTGALPAGRGASGRMQRMAGQLKES